MKESNYTDLIGSLAQQGANPKQINIKRYYLIWSFFASLFFLATLLIFGIRSDLPYLFKSKQFILESIVVLWLVISTGVWAINLSVPGREKKYSFLITFVPFVIWNCILLFAYFSEYSSTPLVSHLRSSFGKMCFTSLFLIGLPPSLVLFFIVRKNNPVLLGKVGLLVFLSGMGLGGLMMQFHCGNSDPLHIFTSHVLPIIIVALIGLKLGKRFLRW